MYMYMHLYMYLYMYMYMYMYTDNEHSCNLKLLFICPYLFLCILYRISASSLGDLEMMALLCKELKKKQTIEELR